MKSGTCHQPRLLSQILKFNTDCLKWEWPIAFIFRHFTLHFTIQPDMKTIEGLVQTACQLHILTIMWCCS